MIDFLLGLFVCQLVSQSVSPSLPLVRFGQLLYDVRCVDKRIVNIMKVYIEANNLQVELIQFLKNYWLYSRLLLRSEEFNPISPTERKSAINNIIHSGRWTVYIVTWNNRCSHRSVVTPDRHFGPVRADQPNQFIQSLQCRGTGAQRNRDKFAWKERGLVHIPS